MRTIGDAALVVDDDAFVLCDARGVRRRWERAHVLDYALLADPPRLALTTRDRGHGSIGIDLVDVSTGEVQRRIEQNFARVVAFARGDAFLAQRGDDLFVVDGDVSARVDGAVRGVYGAVCFDANGDDALCRCVVPDARGPQLVRVSVPHRRASRITHTLDSVTDFVVDPSLMRVALIVDNIAAHVVAAGHVHWFDDRRTIEWRLHDDGDPLPVRLWADRDVHTIAVGHDDGSLAVYDVRTMRDHPAPVASFHVGADVVGLRVDVDRGLIVDGARIFGLDGKRVADVAARASCFAADGVACVVGGSLFLVDARGAVRRIEGPTNIVDVAPHKRGVLALDDEMRAHVIEIGAAS